MGLLLEWGQPAAWCSPQSRSAPSSLVLTPIPQCPQQPGAHPNPAVPPAAWCSPQSSSAHVCLLLMPCQDGGAVKGVLTNPGAGGKWEVASCSCAGITPLVSTHEAEVQLRWHHAPGLDA